MTDERSIDAGYGAIVVAVAALLAYGCALANGFAFDDVVLIPGDPRVVTPHLMKLLTTPYWNDAALALYRPVTSLTFGLDWYVSHGAAAWFHFSNVLWHALASVLAYFLLSRFFRVGAALAGGVLFALHPIHVEAVANVVGRAELIAAVFFFGACLTWTSDTLSAKWRGVLTAICYALAVFAKESALTLPALLLLLDAARGQLGRAYIRARWKDYGLLVVTLLIYMAARWSIIGGLTPSRLDPSIEVTSGWARLLTALQAWPIEARLLFWPRTLLADYGPRMLLPITEFTPLATLGLTLVVVTVIGGLVAFLRGNYRWALGLLWFPITIFTVSNFIVPIGVLVAERTLYLPSFAVVFGAAAVWQVTPLSFSTHRLALALVIALALGLRTAARVPAWKSTDSIMTALVNDRPDSFRAQWHMARVAREHKDVTEALHRYDVAMKLWPYRRGLVQEAAAYAGSQSRAALARDLASWGARRWPNDINFHRLLAANAIDLGDTITARAAVQHGLRINPQDSLLNQMQQAFGARR